ncbi:MAG: hypothetical protein A2Y15_01720 [Clostridiales bacterium GWF2_36_10]|nr:MAG: hypothetical protein A2Y15_01720 [Clostridiales bacterium GWF2_36_10]
MKYAKKNDFYIIGIIIVIGLFFWVLYNYTFVKKGVYAEIYYMSELVERVDLTTGKNRSFSLPQEPDVVFYLNSDGSIRFMESDCPDKICINSGKLSKAGQFAACLPNQIYIKIVSDEVDSDEPDIIIG